MTEYHEDKEIEEQEVQEKQEENVKYILGKKSSLDASKRCNLVLYTIEKINGTPFLYFLMIKNVNDLLQLPNMVSSKIHEFMKDNFFTSRYENRGCTFYKHENYVFYQMFLNDDEFYPTLYQDNWWKVTPFEMIYSKEVLYFPIDYKYVQFFIDNPNLLFLLDSNNNKYEVPIVVYLGIGESQLNEQLLLNELNHYKGIFGRGYYFKTFDKAYEDCVFDYTLPDAHILKLINYNYLTDFIYTTTKDTDEVVIKKNKFYFREIFIGNVPENCKVGKYKLDTYDDDYIYLISENENKCTKTVYEKRNENGMLLRYVFMQNNHNIGPDKPKGFDSYSFNSTYMTKNQESFTCLSYHIVEKKDFDLNEIKIK
jgi:hypothetical protein